MRIGLRILAGIVGFVLLLVIGLFFAIQMPSVQQFAGEKGADWLSKKTNSEVRLAKIRIAFPKTIVLEGLYLETPAPANDTLAYIGAMKVDIGMWALLDNTIKVNDFLLEDVSAHISRSLPDSAWNFDYLTRAFIGEAEDVDTALATEQIKEPTQADTSTGMRIELGNITLKNIAGTYDDEPAGTEASGRIGRFFTRVTTFDLQRMKFGLERVDLENTRGAYVQSLPIPPSPEDTTASLTPEIELGPVQLTNIQGYYEDVPSGMKGELKFGLLKLITNKLDLARNTFALKSLELKETVGSFAINSKKAADLRNASEAGASSAESGNAPPMRISLGKLDIGGLDFDYDDMGQPRVKQGMDYAHLSFKKLIAKVSKIKYSVNSTTASIKQISLRERSGLQIDTLSGRATFDSVHAELTRFILKTPRSRFGPHLSIRYKNLDALANDLENLQFEARLARNYVGMQDIFIFAPDLAKIDPINKMTKNGGGFVNFAADIKGRLGDLRIANFSASTLQGTKVDISGRMQGLPNPEKLYMDLAIKQAATTRGDLKILAPVGSIPPDIQVPEVVSLSGRFLGKTDQFVVDADVKSSQGPITARAELDMRQAGAERFDVTASTSGFQAGTLLKQSKDVLGEVAFEAKASGVGFDVKTMVVDYEAKVQRAYANGYLFRNLTSTGRLVREVLTTSTKMDDPNLKFGLDGALSINPDKPDYDAVLDLQGADLFKLGLYGEDLRVQGKFDVDMRGNTLDEINGTMSATNIKIRKGNEVFPIDQLAVLAVNTDRNTALSLKSDFLNAEFKGTIKITQLMPTLMQHIDSYFDLHQDLEEADPESQNFAFAMEFRRTELLTKVFVPGLTRLSPGTITGSYQSLTKDLKLDVNLPGITYNDIMLDTVAFNLNGDANKLSYRLAIDKILTGGFNIDHPKVFGDLGDDKLGVTLQLQDSAERNKYLVAADIISSPDVFRVVMRDSGTVLNFEPWEVSRGNFIEFREDGLFVNDLQLLNEDRLLKVATQGTSAKDPLRIDFRNFSLGYVSALLERNDTLFRGDISGDVELISGENAMGFTSDLKVIGLSFHNDTLGNVSLKATNQKAGRYDATMSLTGPGTQIFMGGYYNTVDTANALNFDINFKQLNLRRIEAYTFGALREVRGNLEGNLSLRGSTTAPRPIGRLTFENAGFRVSELGTAYEFPDEDIFFTRRGIELRKFTVADTAGHPMDISGVIETNYFTRFKLDLKLIANEFLAINAPYRRNALVFGKMLVNTNLSLTGSAFKPVMRGNIGLKEGTDASFSLPIYEPATVEQEGVVEFLSFDGRDSANILARKDSVAKAGEEFVFEGMDIGLNIDIDPKARVEIIQDPETGDAVRIQGGGALTFNMKPSGAMTLTGRYEITEGSYRLSVLGFVKKNFIVEPGSSITWLGDVLDANVDISAYLPVRTAPITLVENQVTESDRPQFEEEILFHVKMKMTGKLMKPNIAFDIIIPSSGTLGAGGLAIATVEAKLAAMRENESELNKQVLAMIALNRFLPDDPTTLLSGGGGPGTSTSNQAARGASRLLSQQLNQLAGKYIKGVDLNFNLDRQARYDEKAESTSEQTSLGVQAEKDFLDNRLTIRLGADAGVGGGTSGTGVATNDFTTDITIEYKLTPNGGLRLKVFRNNAYVGVIEGQLVETGAGIAFVKDFDKWKDLFKRDHPKPVKKSKEKTLAPASPSNPDTAR